MRFFEWLVSQTGRADDIGVLVLLLKDRSDLHDLIDEESWINKFAAEEQAHRVTDHDYNIMPMMNAIEFAWNEYRRQMR